MKPDWSCCCTFIYLLVYSVTTAHAQRWVFLMCSSSRWMEEHEWNVHSFKFSSLVRHSKSGLRQKSNRNGSLKVWNYQLRLLSLAPPVGLLSKINDLLKHNSPLCCSAGSRRATKSLSWSCNWIVRAQKHKQQSSWITDGLTQHIRKRPHTWWGCVNRLHQMFAREETSQSPKIIIIIILSNSLQCKTSDALCWPGGSKIVQPWQQPYSPWTLSPLTVLKERVCTNEPDPKWCLAKL